MNVGFPTYALLYHVFAACVIALLLTPKRAMLALSPGLLLFMLYGDYANVGAVMIVFLVGFFAGALDSVREA